MIVMMMVVMGCNSGGVKGEGAGGGDGRGLSGAMMEVGRSAENAFYSFLELVSDVLGFTVTKDTTRNKVGEYFSGLGKKLGEASEELEKVASKAIVGVDKGEESKNAKNPVRIAVDTAKGVLSSLKTHLESLKDIGDGNKVVDVANNQNGVAANSDALKKAYKALKGIVDVAKAQKVAEPSASNVTLKQDSIGVDAKDGAKVLAIGAAGAAVGEKAALIVSSVRGEEMLASIVKSGEGDATGNTGQANADTSALKFARGDATAANLAKEEAKAGAVGGGIALRSLVKDGKLAANNNDDKAVQSAGITAVNKLLGAVEGIVKKTVKNILEKVKQEVDKARAPKAAGQN
ncbi:variable large family protein [Borrelia hispanica]|uniref:variable large family protein n=1 Tax=Borrelia hispanica TaxID=40835 RepID=UPI000464E3B6|nr:variable large family protein [Borrelia hispanica]